MGVLIWVRGLISRRLGRLVTAAIGIAIGVALLLSLAGFLVTSKATMTKRAIDSVAVDWQVEAQQPSQFESVMRTVKRFPTVTQALPVAFGHTPGFRASSGGTVQTTGAGVVLGLPPNYETTFPQQVRQLVGSSSGVLVAQQSAANLHVGVGDTVAIRRLRLAPARVTVTGIVDFPQANSLFQQVGAPPAAQPQAPPDNALVVNLARWHRLFDPLARTGVGARSFQVHARLDHTLPPDPASAFAAISGRALNLEAKLSGKGLVGNNLGATLDAARSDALYAQVMFVFLGLPGALLAALLTTTIALTSRERRLKEQALIRTRGATTAQSVRLILSETIVVALLGGIAGVGLGIVLGSFVLGISASDAVLPAAVAASIGVGVAVVAIARPAINAARRSSVNSVTTRDGGRPRWFGLYPDAFLVVLAALAFWATSKSGYALVLAPEGTPQISVSYWAFAAPLFLWMAIALVVVRLVHRILARPHRFVSRIARPFAGRLSGIVASSMGRQRTLMSRSVVLVTLTVTFAISTAVFNSTYRQQARVDALLTNGADVTVTVPPGVNLGPGEAARLAAIPGVSSVEPLIHRFAYVGADLQDLYGVRPSTIVSATQLQDAYFAGGSARDLMGRLAGTPDAALVSDETVRDFQLHPVIR
ncbi:MAG: ABC transporter permease [Actinomycetota bacterium]